MTMVKVPSTTEFGVDRLFPSGFPALGWRIVPYRSRRHFAAVDRRRFPVRRNVAKDIIVA